MFNDLNVFEFTNFSFKSIINNSVVTVINNNSVNGNYLFSRGKQEKKIERVYYLLIFRQNSMIFEGSPNSLTESYFTGELRMMDS